MFEKVGQRAEEFATRLPRRMFFGKVAQGALPLAAALGGFLAMSGESWAIGRGGNFCCFDGDGNQICQGVTSANCCPRGTSLNRCTKGFRDLPPCC